MNNFKKKFCCDQMKYYLNIFFESSDISDNPDVIIKYNQKFDEYGIPVYDGGTSVILIHFCPWCGTKLGDSKRDLWYDEMEKMNIDINNEDEIPEEFKSDKWYNK